MIPVVLASASARRRILLRMLVPEFHVRPADVAEPTGPDAAGVARMAAAMKAVHVARRVRDGTAVVAADTVVAIDGQVLGQPRDADDARRMLRILDGRDHEVLTGLAVHVAGGAQQGTAQLVRSTLRLDISDVLDRYVASGAWEGKAGGYGLQDPAISGHATLASGPWSNVVGLPLQATAEALQACGVPVKAAPDEAQLAQHNPFLAKRP